MRLCIAALSALSLVAAKTHLLETFTEDSFKSWVTSDWKGPENMGKWDISAGDWHGDKEAGRGMRTTEDAKFYAISKKLDAPFSNEGKPLVVQYAVKHEKKGTTFCGGGYIKLLPAGFEQSKFGGETPYYIMFGPDLCGYDVSRIHLIFSKDGENMLKKDDIKMEWAEKNEFTHLYTLIVNPDNTYKVLLDNVEKASGNLGDGQWSKFPLKEIDDPEDIKPADWVEEARIVDPAAQKPADWDESEPRMIKDVSATKPADWDDAEDGEWEAPMIDNPKFKGKWSAPMIDNPAYKGVWAPKKIPNPSYDGKSYVYSDIAVVGFELWVVNSGSIFSNLIITDSVEEAKAFADKIFSADFIENEKEAKKAFDKKNEPKEAEKEDEPVDIEAEDLDQEEGKEEL
jgi:calreticulin